MARVSAEPGHRLETEEDIAQVCGENSFKPEDLEYEMDEYAWADAWEYSESPQANGLRALEGTEPRMQTAWHPGRSECWVELRNDLTVSLLQAHIVERDLPLKITIDDV